MTYIRLSKGTLAELPVLEWFQKLGYEVRASPEISPGGEHPERKSYIKGVLTWRLHTAMAGRNSHNAFAVWYNNRVHGALDLEYFETPNDAFIMKMGCENTLGMFFEWSEREVSL